jgi:hypothetical protein
MSEILKAQLSLGLSNSEQRSQDVSTVNQPNVVSFIDASTMNFRIQAKDRVTRAGIFSPYRKQIE